MPHRLLAALALSVALVLSGCSDDPEPKVAPEPSASTSSVAASPSSSSGTSNSSSDELEFIDMFITEVTRAIDSGDPSGFMAMADDSCANCEVIADNLTSAYEDGGRITGGEWLVLSAEPSPGGNGSDVWDVRIRTAREQWLDARGQVIKTVAPSVQTIAMSLRPASDGWRIQELQLR